MTIVGRRVADDIRQSHSFFQTSVPRPPVLCLWRVFDDYHCSLSCRELTRVERWPIELCALNYCESTKMPGYEVTFVNPLKKAYECPICHFAMKNPVQTECGHLFCRDCLDSTLNQKQPICPVDMEEIRIDNIFRDNAVRREILGLEVYCRFKSDGCCWSGTLNSLEVCHQLKEVIGVCG